jgi:hypothetical protein
MKVASTKADYDPLCPHCEKPIKEVHWREIKAILQWEHVFICPLLASDLHIYGREGAAEARPGSSKRHGNDRWQAGRTTRIRGPINLREPRLRGHPSKRPGYCADIARRSPIISWI